MSQYVNIHHYYYKKNQTNTIGKITNVIPEVFPQVLLYLSMTSNTEEFAMTENLEYS